MLDTQVTFIYSSKQQQMNLWLFLFFTRSTQEGVRVHFGFTAVDLYFRWHRCQTYGLGPSAGSLLGPKGGHMFYICNSLCPFSNLLTT